MPPAIEAPALSRRTFLDALLTVGFVSTAAAMAYPVARFLLPPATGEPATDSVVAARAGALRPNSAAIFKFGSKPGIVVRTAEGDLRAFSAVCTHLDCTVQFKTDTSQLKFHGATDGGFLHASRSHWICRVSGQESPAFDDRLETALGLRCGDGSPPRHGNPADVRVEAVMNASTVQVFERAMLEAIGGRLSKPELALLLTPDARRRFEAACAAIELKYTDECRAMNDPCLESGCSAEGERCLQPLLRAEEEYQSACGGEWAKLFADPENRDHAWTVRLANPDRR